MLGLLSAALHPAGISEGAGTAKPSDPGSDAAKPSDAGAAPRHRRLFVSLTSLAGLSLLLICYFASWHYVESAKAAGGLSHHLKSHWWESPLFFLYALSFMVGASTLATAAGAAAGIAGATPIVWVFKLAAMALPIMGLPLPMLQHHTTPYFFGIGGGIIALCVAVTLMLWARQPGARSMGDYLKAEGYVLFAAAAWNTCGLLGPTPGAALAPHLQRAGTADATALAHVVMLFWVAGWLATAAGHWLNACTFLPVTVQHSRCPASSMKTE